MQQNKWILLNNQVVNRAEGTVDLEKDKQAVREFFLGYVNKNMRWFESLDEKLNYLIDNGYYVNFYDYYSYEEIKAVYTFLYDKKFRFTSYMSAFLFYKNYAMKDVDGSNFLERYEDRIASVALYTSIDLKTKKGNVSEALAQADIMISQEYQPATPTFANSGKLKGGQLVSCFLTEIGDSLSGIAKAIEGGLKLSSMGGGVAYNVSKLRGRHDAIKGIDDRASGALPVMKILEDVFSYANQLGSRPGAGAVYLNIFHSDIEEFLDSKKINADEKLRIKSLSLGIIVPKKFMELAENDEPYYVFQPYTVFKEYNQHLDDMDIDVMYPKLLENPRVKKKKLNARKMLVSIASIQKESGYPYFFLKTNANEYHPLKGIGSVNFSNLCVAGDTKILTDKGYKTIKYLDNRKVNVWNGEEFSEVTVLQTAQGNASLLKVSTSAGVDLECTPYHKFYTQKGYARGKVKEVRASELKLGDKLIKFSLPVIEGTKELSKAYTNGFFTGDGTAYYGREKGEKIYSKIYLYGEKKALKEHIEYTGEWSEFGDRLSSANIEDLQPKFFVPSVEYTIQSRLKWLAGVIDSDGTLTDNNGSQSIQISSIDKAFLTEMLLMLQTLGVDSKISKLREANKQLLPLNDGTGQYAEFDVQDCYRLLINGNSVFNLGLLGLGSYLHRIKPSFKAPNRKCSQFIKITGISELEGKHDTYCFTEPKRHMGMFNGLLTGNCTEIMQVSKVSEYNDYNKTEQDEINYGISCNLGSLNIGTVMDSSRKQKGRFEHIIKHSVNSLTFVTDVTDIGAVPDIARANRDFRAIGLGAMNLHGYLAKEEIMYESKEALDFVNVFFSMMNFYSLKRSMEISRDRGCDAFKGFEKSEYASGAYFDRYESMILTPQTDRVKELFEGIEVPTKEDWVQLKHDVMVYGVYHAYRQAIAPNQSTAYIMSATPSLMPITDQVEVREYDHSTTYYPMPYLNNDNMFFFKSAYDMDQFKVLKLMSVIQRHIDQGISCILHTNSADDTAKLAQYYVYASKMGLKSLYYTRTRKSSIEDCISCSA